MVKVSRLLTGALIGLALCFHPLAVIRGAEPVTGPIAADAIGGQSSVSQGWFKALSPVIHTPAFEILSVYPNETQILLKLDNLYEEKPSELARQLSRMFPQKEQSSQEIEVAPDRYLSLDAFNAMTSNEERTKTLLSAIATTAARVEARAHENIRTTQAILSILRKLNIEKHQDQVGELLAKLNQSKLEELKAGEGLFLSEHTRKLINDAQLRIAEQGMQDSMGLREVSAQAITPEDHRFVVLTKNFLRDVKNWRDQDWRRLEQEITKLRDRIADGKPLTGQQGNVRFLQHTLSGLGEFKFGENRHSRLFFRYDPEKRQIFLTRYLPKENVRPGKARLGDLRKWLMDATLISQISEETGGLGHITIPDIHPRQSQEGRPKDTVISIQLTRPKADHPKPALSVSHESGDFTESPPQETPRLNPEEESKFPEPSLSEISPRPTASNNNLGAQAAAKPENPQTAEAGTISKPNNSRYAERFIADSEASVSTISLLRAIGHRFKNWKDDTVFQFPLTTSDHRILFWLGRFAPLCFFLMPVILFIPLFLKNGFDGWTQLSWSFLIFACTCSLSIGVGIGALSWAAPHLTEARDGRQVYLHAKLFSENPRLSLDGNLMNIVKKFEKETGWTVRFTTVPHVLAKVEPQSRRVIMSVGWFVRSEQDRQKRRLAYLTQTLRTIRHAVEDTPPVNREQAGTTVPDTPRKT